MAKKAILVNFDVMVRAVVDVPDGVDPNSDEAFDKVAEAAIKRVRKGVIEDNNFPYSENIISIEEDKEIPFGKGREDHITPDDLK